MQVLRSAWQSLLVDSWQAIDETAAQERSERERTKAGYDYRPLIVLCSGSLLLTAMHYWGFASTFYAVVAWVDAHFPMRWLDAWRRSPYWGLAPHVWWSGWRVLGFFLVPALIIRLYGERVVDQGLRGHGFTTHLRTYAILYGLVLIPVVAVSLEDSFTTYYPFYAQSGRSWADLLLWELVYAAQFFSLEFFFRGWWLQACKATMGSRAIFAMVVPYVMIHFGKPMVETCVAFIAGIALGTLAMKTRSIWGGFLIHVAVAVSMDVLVLVHKSGLPTHWWP